MTPSRIRTGPSLRSAIAMVTNTPKDRALHPRLQGRAARIRPEPLGDKTLKHHLVGVTRGPGALLRRLHRPGQQRQAKDVAGDPGCRRWQLIEPRSDEMVP